ncbi:MAG: Uma2 family endonuclease [Coleofasciculaceae cyanobacterium]
MTVTIPLKSIQLAPGSSVTINDVTWQDFETILTELGEQRQVRLTYFQGNLEMMSPQAAIHERPHRIIADIVKALLEVRGRDWEDFGSTTFKLPVYVGVETDGFFYIQNAAQMQIYKQMDVAAIYLPPDLAIESDVTPKKILEVYAAIGVPEVWIYHQQKLEIYTYINGSYQESFLSPAFPDFAVVVLIPILVQEAIEVGTSKMLQKLKSEIK